MNTTQRKAELDEALRILSRGFGMSINAMAACAEAATDSMTALELSQRAIEWAECTPLVVALCTLAGEPDVEPTLLMVWDEALHRRHAGLRSEVGAVIERMRLLQASAVPGDANRGQA